MRARAMMPVPKWLIVAAPYRSILQPEDIVDSAVHLVIFPIKLAKSEIPPMFAGKGCQEHVVT